MHLGLRNKAHIRKDVGFVLTLLNLRYLGLLNRTQPDCYDTIVPTAKLLILVAVFFFTSILSVVTGSTSLITVPVMISLGIEAHVAIATNMLALTSMSVGGSIPFAGKGIISRSRLGISLPLTVVGSAMGALLLLAVPVRPLRVIIAVAMIAVAAFSIANQKIGIVTRDASTSRAAGLIGYVATFFLGLYGGFFSGGYVTMLTAVFVVAFGMTFLQAVATTKFVNVFSSGVATLVFLSRGLVNLRLGIILGISMFLGALLGARLTLLLHAVWLRRVFIVAVLGLAAKMLISLH